MDQYVLHLYNFTKFGAHLKDVKFPRSVHFGCCGHVAESSIEVTCNFSIKSKYSHGAETLTLAQNSVTR